MYSISKFVPAALIGLTLAVLLVSSADAHLMAAQHGTLNVVGNGAFMVLSVPVSAFEGTDDDKDGQLSMEEFTRHRIAIAEVVKQNVVLRDMSKSLPLDGVMLSPVPEHDNLDEPVSQLMVLGRFALEGSVGPLQFQFSLFGMKPSEQLLEITATNKSAGLEYVFDVTPATPSSHLFL